MTHAPPPSSAEKTATRPRPRASAPKRSPRRRRCTDGMVPLGSRYHSRPTQGRSSVGRAAVSKTVGRRFESCRPCWLNQAEWRHACRCLPFRTLPNFRPKPLETAREWHVLARTPMGYGSVSSPKTAQPRERRPSLRASRWLRFVQARRYRPVRSDARGDRPDDERQDARKEAVAEVAVFTEAVEDRDERDQE